MANRVANQNGFATQNQAFVGMKELRFDSSATDGMRQRKADNKSDMEDPDPNATTLAEANEMPTSIASIVEIQENSTFMNIFTVFLYAFFVILPSLLLCAYYYFLWDGEVKFRDDAPRMES